MKEEGFMCACCDDPIEYTYEGILLHCAEEHGQHIENQLYQKELISRHSKHGITILHHWITLESGLTIYKTTHILNRSIANDYNSGNEIGKQSGGNGNGKSR